MGKVLVITEKPRVAQKIAQILGEGSVKSEKRGRVTLYRFERDDEEWVVAPASGHVLELDFPDSKKEWTFPVIYPPEELVFRPIRSKSAYLRVIREEGRDADRIIVATDLDTEGSAIGLEIVRYLGWEGEKEILRAEFSALTPEAIERAFADLRPFDYPRANAGWARRVLDLEWGANVTRALTLSTREHSWVKVLSGGRVQSPALALIVRREEEIRNFVPRKYYVVTGTFETPRGETFEAVALPPKG
ncbi:MAG: DNA topoisomerase, partial [Candidatus Korarchaeota archaeon]|nr:DNA topoisomerase [Candidatus Korarchaeota archaeon]